MGKEFAQRGYVAFCINYRLYKMGRDLSIREIRDIEVSDAVTALEWIRSNNTMYGIDRRKIIVAGDSAGGAIVTSLSYKDEAASGVAACINLWGAMPSGIGDNSTYPWGGNQFEQDIPANAPATLLIHGTGDVVAPYQNSVKMAKRLEAANIKYEFYTLEGSNHYPEEKASEFIPVMIKFADEVLSAFEEELPVEEIPPEEIVQQAEGNPATGDNGMLLLTTVTLLAAGIGVLMIKKR
jgi:acetyl esterase